MGKKPTEKPTPMEAAPMGGGVYPSAPGANDPSPQGMGTGMGRVQVRPAADPPLRGLMLQCRQGFHSSHPLQGGPQTTVPHPSGWAGRGRGGAPPTPPSHFSPTFARFPTSIGSVRKLIVYKYPSSARPGTQVEAAGGHQGPPQPWRPAGAGRGLFPAGKGP